MTCHIQPLFPVLGLCISFFVNWYLIFKFLYVVRCSLGPLISLKDRLNVFLRKGDIRCYYSVIPGYTSSIPL